MGPVCEILQEAGCCPLRLQCRSMAVWLTLQAASLTAGCGIALMGSLNARPGAAGLLFALVAAGLFGIAYSNGHPPRPSLLFCRPPAPALWLQPLTRVIIFCPTSARP